RARVQCQLDAAQTLLARQRQSMLPQHPQVRQTQHTIDQFNARIAELDGRYGQTYRDDLTRQREAAQRKVEELKPLIEQQSKLAQDYSTKTARLAELEGGLKRADAALAEVDAKMRDLAVSAGSSAQGPPTMRIVQPAQAPHHPSHPDRTRTLAIALLAGLIGGCLFAGI